MSAKQDGVSPRTPTDLERKYNWGQRFAEVIGIATDAQEKAEEVKSSVKDFDENLTSEEILNRLTNDGALQGLFRGEDGELYINAKYIKALEELFANDIKMTGKFTHTAKVFIEPGRAEMEKLQKHVLRTEIIPVSDFPLYDFNNDGDITISDMACAQMAELGIKPLADYWSGAVKTDITVTLDMSNPAKFIHITGKNMWGGDVDKYIGINFTNIKNPETEQKLEYYLVESSFEGCWAYEKWSNGTSKCWGSLNNSYGNLIAVSDTGIGDTPVEYTSRSAAFPDGLFVSPPIVIATARDSGGLGVVAAADDGSTETTCKVFIWGSGQAFSSINVMAFGRWK